ncbi:MAG: acylphosphatase [Propionibacteriaceae bacterium]|nr:acylphosphatase [Propionibacteriaceae bacterium]
MRRIHAIISGQVQGVGFRYHTQRVSERLQLTGWVRNLPDGTVEAEVEGDQESVEKLLAWLGDGPAGARVRHVRVTDITPAGGSGFDVRF